MTRQSSLWMQAPEGRPPNVIPAGKGWEIDPEEDASAVGAALNRSSAPPVSLGAYRISYFTALTSATYVVLLTPACRGGICFTQSQQMLRETTLLTPARSRFGPILTHRPVHNRIQ